MNNFRTCTATTELEGVVFMPRHYGQESGRFTESDGRLFFDNMLVVPTTSSETMKVIRGVLNPLDAIDRLEREVGGFTVPERRFMYRYIKSYFEEAGKQ